MAQHCLYWIRPEFSPSHKHSERRWSLHVYIAVPGEENELSSTKALVFSEMRATSPQPEGWPRPECSGRTGEIMNCALRKVTLTNFGKEKPLCNLQHGLRKLHWMQYAL